jgi:hypothetical protein
MVKGTVSGTTMGRMIASRFGELPWGSEPGLGAGVAACAGPWLLPPSEPC